MADQLNSLNVPIDPVLRELGRVVFNFNASEQALRRLAFLMIDPGDERIGEITVDRLGANGLEELVRALGAYRLAEFDVLAERVTLAVSRFSAVRLRRNEYVHAVWVVPNDFTDPSEIAAVTRKFRKGTMSNVASLDPRPIAEVASEASALSKELQAIHEAAKAFLTARDRRK